MSNYIMHVNTKTIKTVNIKRKVKVHVFLILIKIYQVLSGICGFVQRTITDTHGQTERHTQNEN